jgi:Glycosyl hydrolase family 99/Secretion system C-terminal sorting domain
MMRKRLLVVILLSILSGYTSVFSQLTLPLRAAFYYSWYPATWTVNGAHVFYQPTLGYYSSDSQAVADQHIKDMDYANINVAIASWWGINQQSENTRIPMLLNRTIAAGSALKWAMYYEKEGFGNPTVAEIQADLAYIKQNYVPSQAYATINGKPVIFVYNADDTSCEVADRWAQATNNEWYLSLKVIGGFQSCANQPSTWHQYGPNSPEQSQNGFFIVIAPGFWRADVDTPLLARDPTRFSKNVRDMVASKQPWQLITTFNEWGEGTAVESAKDWESASGYGIYLDALHNNGNPSSIVNKDDPGKTMHNLSMPQNTELNIYDLKGRLVKTLANRTLGDYSIDINKNVLPQGMYFLKLKTEQSGSLSKKIVIY